MYSLQKADAKASRARKAQATLEGLALRAKNVHLSRVIYILGSMLMMKDAKAAATQKAERKYAERIKSPSSR